MRKGKRDGVGILFSLQPESITNAEAPWNQFSNYLLYQFLNFIAFRKFSKSIIYFVHKQKL